MNKVELMIMFLDRNDDENNNFANIVTVVNPKIKCAKETTLASSLGGASSRK